jgi:hypothetical protein
VSSAARQEAIRIVAGQLDERFDVAMRIVDKLLETHAISRRAPRRHRPAHPDARPVVQRILESGR